MNINAFSNMDAFDLSGAVIPPAEGLEQSDDFSGLLAEFTTMLAPALSPSTPMRPKITDFSVSLAEFSKTADLTIEPADGSVPTPSAAPRDGEQLPTAKVIFGEGLAATPEVDRSWANRFGIERIKTQILEGVIDRPAATPQVGRAWVDRFGIDRIKAQVSEGDNNRMAAPEVGWTAATNPVTSESELWSGVFTDKSVDEPPIVKNGPRLPPLEPGETPPIIVINDPSQRTPLNAPIKTRLFNEFKKTLNQQTPPLATSEPLRTIRRPPLAVGPIFEPSGVNEAPEIPTIPLPASEPLRTIRRPPLAVGPIFEPSGVNEAPEIPTIPLPASEPLRTVRRPPLAVGPIFEPSGVNEAPEIQTASFPTDDLERLTDGSQFLGPPQEAPEPVVMTDGPISDRRRIRGPLADFPQIGGIKPIRDLSLPTDAVASGEFNQPQPLAIKLTPKFDGSKISGFEIKPSDLETVIRTFESYLKIDEKPLREVKSSPAQSVPETFVDISDSIRRTLEQTIADAPLRSAGIQKAAETIAGIRPVTVPFAPRIKTDAASAANEDNVAPDAVELPENVDIFSRFAPTDENFAVRERQINVTRPEFIVDFKRTSPDRDATEPLVTNGAGQLEAMTKSKGSDPVPANVDFAARLFSPEKVAAQVGSHLLDLAKMSFARDERPSIKLRLNPQELGTVEVTIERNENGSLNATFRTETVEAQQALSQHLETLRETLQNSGWQVGKMDVSSGADFSRGNQQQPQEGRGNARVLDFLNSADAAVPESGGGDRDSRLVSLLA